jgi:hypothetical protein
MLKNIFIVSAPKWFRVVYKVLSIFLSRKLRDRVRIHTVNVNRTNKDLDFISSTLLHACCFHLFTIITHPYSFQINSILHFSFKVTLYSVDQMRDYLITQYGYSLDNIPISLGGSFDPVLSSNIRHQQCLSKVTNSQSICYSYYSPHYQPLTTKSPSNILFYNTDHHNQDKSVASTTVSTTPSLVAIVALRRHNESSSQLRVRKRESSSSSDNDKRHRSNESLIEEESPINNSSSYLRKENFDE